MDDRLRQLAIDVQAAVEDKEVKRKLGRHIYCIVCRLIGLVEDFDWEGMEYESDKYCPRCLSTDLINASNLKICPRCNNQPATPYGELCLGCALGVGSL